MRRTSAHRRRERVRRLPLLAALIRLEPVPIKLTLEDLLADLNWGRDR